MLLIVFLGLFVGTRIPDLGEAAAPAPTAYWLAPGQDVDLDTVADKHPGAGLHLKELLASGLSAVKKERLPLADLHTGGGGIVFAGIRANACIPADRVRQTVVPATQGFYLRAPPACV
jgi:hypothetical protein